MPTCVLSTDGVDIHLVGAGYVPGQTYQCRLRRTTAPAPQNAPEQQVVADAAGQITVRWPRAPGRHRHRGSVWSLGVRLATSAVLET